MSCRLTLVLLTVLVAVPALDAGIPESSQPRAELMKSWRHSLKLADHALFNDNPEEAERIYREIIEEAAMLDEENLLVARAIDGMADLLRDGERPEEAAELYRKAAEMWPRLLGPAQPRTATTLHNLAVVEMTLGDFEPARVHLLEALEIWESALGADSPQAQASRRTFRQLQQRSGADLKNTNGEES
jgi:tetratricopeptide (TPR) repeat protein